MLTMPPASDPGTPSTISPSTRSRFLRRRCSRAPSNPSPCPTGALHDPSTALVSLHGAWLDLSTTLADLISTACSDLSATASPQLQTNLTALTADSSHLVFPKMASPTRPMGRDLYRLQEPSYLPLAQEEIVTKSLPGLLRNLKRCQTYSLAKGGQDRAISVTSCCQAQEAMIPRLPGWSHHQIHNLRLFSCAELPCKHQFHTGCLRVLVENQGPGPVPQPLLCPTCGSRGRPDGMGDMPEGGTMTYKVTTFPVLNYFIKLIVLIYR